MDLKVRTTHTVTTDDLELFCDPPLSFEAVGRVGPKLHNDLLTWSQAGYPAEQAPGLAAQLFLSVSQDGQSYPLNSPAAATELQNQVGDEFIRNLIEAFWDFEYRFFKQKRLASGNSGPRSNAGANPAG